MNYKTIAEQLGPRIGATQEWVFNVLRSGIVSGQLTGGTQLKQDEISAALNVSHIPVREALRRLEAQGLVTIHANRGASVTKLTRDDVLDMMEVRATLAVMQLKKGAPLLNDDDYQEMEEIVHEQRETSDLLRCEELNYKFHGMFSRHAENTFATLMTELVHANIDRYLRKDFYELSQRRSVSVNQHEQILDACKNGDYDKAADLLRMHILDAKTYIPDDLS